MFTFLKKKSAAQPIRENKEYFFFPNQD